MNRRWEWIILSVISLIVFEENIVVTVLAKLVPLFFKCSCAFSFLTRSLIDRCQIVTDTCIKMFQSLFGSLLNHLYHYANENVSVKLLSLICITSILTTIYSLKNCSVYGRSCCNHSPKSLGFLWNEFRQFSGKKIKMSFTSLTRSVLGKTVPEVVSTARGRRLGNNTYIFKWLIYPHSPQ